MVNDKKMAANSITVQKRQDLALVTVVVSKTNRPWAVIRPGCPFRVTAVDAQCLDETGAVSIDARILGQTGIIDAPTWAVNGTPEDFDVGALVGRVDGVLFEKAASTGLSFTAAHKITAETFGVILLQITAAGVISTKVPAATQAYASAALALAALPAADATKVAIGYLAIEAGAADWDANTDDLTNGSDLETVAFTAVADAPSALASAVGFVDGSYVEGSLSTTLANRKGDSDEDIVLLYTSDGTGALVNGFASVGWRPRPLSGEAS